MPILVTVMLNQASRYPCCCSVSHFMALQFCAFLNTASRHRELHSWVIVLYLEHTWLYRGLLTEFRECSVAEKIQKLQVFCQRSKSALLQSKALDRVNESISIEILGQVRKFCRGLKCTLVMVDHSGLWLNAYLSAASELKVSSLGVSQFTAPIKSLSDRLFQSTSS